MGTTRTSIEAGDIAFDAATGRTLGVVEQVYNWKGVDLAVVVDTADRAGHVPRHREFPIAELRTQRPDATRVRIDPGLDHTDGVFLPGGMFWPEALT